MATLTLNARRQGGDRDARAVERYSLCYVLGGDCYYELHARMIETQKRLPALVAAGATDFSVLKPDGTEVATHDDLIRCLSVAFRIEPLNCRT